MDELVGRVADTLLGWLRLGNEVVETPHATFTRNATCHQIYDANHGSAVLVDDERDVEALLAAADEILAASRHRAYRVDPRTPPVFEARLALDGYTCTTDLQLLLPGALSARPVSVGIREVESPDDWDTLRQLMRADDEDEGARTGAPVRAPEVSAQMFATKRAKVPVVTHFLARVDDVDCAFISSWPGDNGVGKVEDLFTLPEFRRRGIATALIARAVDHARARGAGPMVIGADPDDTPKEMYAAMGFRPFLLLRNYVLSPAPDA